MNLRLLVGTTIGFGICLIAAAGNAEAATAPSRITTDVTVAKTGVDNNQPYDNTSASAYTDSTGHIVTTVAVQGVDSDGFPDSITTKKMSAKVSKYAQDAYITVWMAKGMTDLYSQFTTSTPGVGNSFGPGAVTHKVDGSTVIVFEVPMSQNLVSMVVDANDPTPTLTGIEAPLVTSGVLVNSTADVNASAGHFNLDAEASTNSAGQVVTYAAQILSAGNGVDTFGTTGDIVVAAKQGASVISAGKTVVDVKAATVTVTVPAAVKVVDEVYSVSTSAGVGYTGRGAVSKAANGVQTLTFVVANGQHLDSLSVYANDSALPQIDN